MKANNFYIKEKRNVTKGQKTHKNSWGNPSRTENCAFRKAGGGLQLYGQKNCYFLYIKNYKKISTWGRLQLDGAGRFPKDVL